MPKDWDKVQEPIKKFYLEEDRLLADVKERLEKDHDFVCSTRALQMKLKEWNYCKYRTNENKATFRGKRKRSSATSQELYRPEHRTGTSIPSETIDLCTPPPPTTPHVHSNSLKPELFPAGTSSRSSGEYQTPAGLTLHEAVKLNDATLIDKLLRAGADVHAYDGDGLQALHYAVSQYSNAFNERRASILANQLLSFGAGVASWTGRPEPSNSALNHALWSPKLLKTLLRSQLDPNVQDLVGDAPLHKAIQETQKCDMRESLEILLEAKADPNLRNNKGETPFYTALKAFREHPVDIPLVAFVEKGADVDADVPDIGCPFQALAEDYISKPDLPYDYSRSWEAALHSLLLRTSTKIPGRAYFSIALQNLALHCLSRIALAIYPSESVSTLTIALCQRLATDPELSLHGVLILFLPLSTRTYTQTPDHPILECVSMLLACPYRQLLKHSANVLDDYLYMIIEKTPGPTDCDALLELLSAGADPFGGPTLLVTLHGPLSVYLATEGLSRSSERLKIVRVLLREWISQEKLSLEFTTPTTAFWTCFADRCHKRTWEPPDSPVLITGTIKGEKSAEDRRALWEIMVELMANECLTDSDLERTKMILKDVRKMGIDLKPEWIHLLLDRN